MPLTARVAWAQRLGIVGGDEREDGEGEVAHRLRLSARSRALEVLDPKRMRTTLGWTQDYVDATGRCPLFRDLRYVGDIMAGGYNAATLEGVAEYMRASGSKRARHEGELLRADGIQACAGMLRRMREVSTRCEVVGPSMMLTASLGFKGMRKAEPAAGERDTRRAFRAAYFVLLAAAGWDRVSVMGEEAWAMALTAHNAILRGGEVGRRDGYAFDPQVGLTLRSVVWCLPSQSSGGYYWLILWVVPIKDQTMTQSHSAPHPIPIRRRQMGGERGADPLCTYDAIEAVWVRKSGVPAPHARADWVERTGGGRLAAGHPRARDPLFVHAGGGAWSTSQVRAEAQRMASAAGEDGSRFGAKSYRAGGATDLRVHLGDDDKSKAVIKGRGRWWSDVAEIYQRTLLSAQLLGSVAMGAVGGVDMEAMCAGWSQPS